MGKLGSAGVLLALLGVVSAQKSSVCTPAADGNFHDFSSDLLDESATIDFADYAGKVSSAPLPYLKYFDCSEELSRYEFSSFVLQIKLVVNTASF